MSDLQLEAFREYRPGNCTELAVEAVIAGRRGRTLPQLAGVAGSSLAVAADKEQAEAAAHRKVFPDPAVTSYTSSFPMHSTLTLLALSQ